MNKSFIWVGDKVKVFDEKGNLRLMDSCENLEDKLIEENAIEVLSKMKDRLSDKISTVNSLYSKNSTLSFDHFVLGLASLISFILGAECFYLFEGVTKLVISSLLVLSGSFTVGMFADSLYRCRLVTKLKKNLLNMCNEYYKVEDLLISAQKKLQKLENSHTSVEVNSKEIPVNDIKRLHELKSELIKLQSEVDTKEGVKILSKRRGDMDE